MQQLKATLIFVMEGANLGADLVLTDDILGHMFCEKLTFKITFSLLGLFFLH